ncbi:hypothetical protein [Sinorhizobium meliloti]|uniref:hypothetical protein n=1 Tax=Rhizobium meliloti TaxID=382 RepID=UPI000FD6D218|nr:hypothetical protein [Sinorhizobium meliloti]RVJ47352.1 hypothetical protein CN175_28065 [Sinorhizobium meliloti]
MAALIDSRLSGRSEGFFGLFFRAILSHLADIERRMVDERKRDTRQNRKLPGTEDRRSDTAPCRIGGFHRQMGSKPEALESLDARGFRPGVGLDRIALALGYEMGAFHAPRIPLDPDQAAEEVADTLGNLEQVAVAPMKTHRAVREAMSCQAFLVHRPEVPDTYDQDIANLVEWLDFASFSLAEEFRDHAGEMPARRQLYTDILDCVIKMERRGLTVLVGVMYAPQPKLPNWKVAILSISPKLTDPGAVKRSQVFVDRRNIVLQNMSFGDIGSIIRGA